VRGEPTSFWGKLGMAEDGSRQWHPLSHHCADVAAVAETLLDLPVWYRRPSRLARRDLTRRNNGKIRVSNELHRLLLMKAPDAGTE
jgi:hypothetical protein